MLAPNPRQTVDEQRAARHRANVEECRPFLDRSIPLGFPVFEGQSKIARYYQRKHQRGEFGTFWPLHQFQTFGR